MAVADLDARFDHVDTSPGTLAHVAREAAREAARKVSDAAGEHDSTAGVVAVIQAFETTAHTASRLLNYPVPEQEDRRRSDGESQGDPSDDSGGDVESDAPR